MMYICVNWSTDVMDENVRVLFEWFSQSYDAFVSGKVSVDYRISEHDGNFFNSWPHVIIGFDL